MPNTVLSLLSNSGSISIIDERKNTPVMQSLKIKSVTIENLADVSELPLADSQLNSTVIFKSTQRSDLGAGKVVMPSRVTVDAFSDDVSVTASLFSEWEDLESSIKIITRSVIIQYLVIIDIVVTQSPDMLDASQINIIFQQTSAPTIGSYTPQQSGDSSMVGTSFETPTSLTTTVSNFASQIQSKIASAGTFISNIPNQLGI
jgi:hypothetical protein